MTMGIRSWHKLSRDRTEWRGSCWKPRSTADSKVLEEGEEEEEEGEEEDGEEDKKKKEGVTPTLWGGTFCRHLQASANFVEVDVSVEVHYCVDM
jgi:hypothetical protein